MIENSIAERLLIRILKQEMGIAEDHIWLANQNVKLKNNEDLFISVGFVDGKVISNVRNTVPDDEGMTEIQQIAMRENIQIDLMSKSNEAALRRWEVIAALSSVYSAQVQEENQFKIFRIPSTFINASGAEGGSNINRFSIIVPCHTWYRKEKKLQTPSGDYFDDFKTRVDDEKTIGTTTGIIELDLKEA